MEKLKSVCILGLGPSVNQYLEVTKRIGGRHKLADEIWGINALGGVFECDKIFHMDDVRIQEIRAKSAPESNISVMLDWIKNHKGPIVTSRAHPDYPGLVEFPLEAVLNEFGHDYFNSTAAYAVAYAIFLGVEKLMIFGNDFTYPNSHDAEKGRACVEFWLGVASQRGIKISLPQSTSLMDAMMTRAARLYGYDCVDVIFHEDETDNKKINLEFKEKSSLPTAEEIETNYDHSVHPNPLVTT